MSNKLKEKIKPEVEKSLDEMYFGCSWCKGSDSGIDSKNVSVEALLSHYARRMKEHEPVKHVAKSGERLEFCCLMCKKEYLASEKMFAWTIKVASTS